MKDFFKDLNQLLWVVTHCSSEEYQLFIRWPVSVEGFEEWDNDWEHVYLVRFQRPALGFRIKQSARDEYRKQVLGLESELDDIPF